MRNLDPSARFGGMLTTRSFDIDPPFSVRLRAVFGRSRRFRSITAAPAFDGELSCFAVYARRS